MDYWVNLQGHSVDRNLNLDKKNSSYWEYEKDKIEKCFLDGIVGLQKLLEKWGIIIKYNEMALAVTPPWLFPLALVDLDLLDDSRDQKNIAQLICLELQKIALRLYTRNIMQFTQIQVFRYRKDRFWCFCTRIRSFNEEKNNISPDNIYSIQS